MEIEALFEERNPVLIATFRDGYAAGWCFAIGENFKDALDIKYTLRKSGAKSEYVWTQGRQFNFSEGAIIYDTPLAYQKEWNEARKHIKLFIQVIEATPSEYVTYKTIKTVNNEMNVIVSGKNENGNQKQESVSDGFIIRRVRLEYGIVKFKLFRPKNTGEIEDVVTITCNQGEFVNLLQTGIIRTLNNQTIDIFKEYGLNTLTLELTFELEHPA